MFGAIAGGIASALAGGAMAKLFGGGQKPPPGAFKVMWLLPITILEAWVMLVLNLPFKALMFLTLMKPSLVLFLVLWLKLVKDFLKVRCRLALLPFLISCLIWLDLVASLPLIKE